MPIQGINVIVDGVEVDKKWLDGIAKSANTSWRYRKYPNSKYKIGDGHDEIGYTIRGREGGPLQAGRDYYIQKTGGNWIAIDSDGNEIDILDKYPYYDEDGKLHDGLDHGGGIFYPYDNGEAIRELALSYGNTKDKSRIKVKKVFYTPEFDNINREGREVLNNLKQQDRDSGEGGMAKYEQYTFEYPYKDANGKNVMKASQAVIKNKNATLGNLIPHNDSTLRRGTRVPSSRGQRKYS